MFSRFRAGAVVIAGGVCWAAVCGCLSLQPLGSVHQTDPAWPQSAPSDAHSRSAPGDSAPLSSPRSLTTNRPVDRNAETDEQPRDGIVVPQRAPQPIDATPGGGQRSTIDDLAPSSQPAGPVLEPPEAATETSVSLAVAVDPHPNVGRNCVLQLNLLNTGRVPLEDVVVVADLEPGLTLPGRDDRRVQVMAGRLAVGDRRSLPLTVIAGKQGRLGCRFEVRTATRRLLTKQMFVDFADAALDIKVVGPDRRTLGSRAEYLVRLTNRGTRPIHKLQLTVNYSDSLKLVASTKNAQAADGGQAWQLAKLAAGEAATFQLEFVCQRISDACHVTAAASAEGFGNPRQDVTLQVAPGSGNLDLQVLDLQDPVRVGQECRYRALVQDLGLQPLRQIEVRIKLPAACRVLEIAVRRDGALQRVPYRVAGREVSFESIPVLSADSELAFDIRVQALRPGDVVFQASARHALSNQSVVSSEPTTFLP